MYSGSKQPKINEIKERIRQLKRQRAALINEVVNTENFLLRYKNFINGPDGAFGVFSDEVLIRILMFLPPKQILYGAPCSRFYMLREYVLELLCKEYIVQYKVHIDNIIKYIFTSKPIFYCYILSYHTKGKTPMGITHNIISDNIEFRTRFGYCRQVEYIFNKTKGTFDIDIKIGSNIISILRKINDNKIIIHVDDEFTIHINNKLDISFGDMHPQDLQLDSRIITTANKKIFEELNTN
jgi:hypothetical protein